MNTSFFNALAQLGADAAFRVARAARPAAEYLFATILPERQRNSYYVEDGTMRIVPTMAGLVAMDSPYPPGGVVEISTFLEESAKIANSNTIPEKALREIQAMVQQLALGGGNTNEALVREALNFLDKVILQPHMDTMEWLRGQALVYGQINWTFNNKNLLIDYGIPAANLLTTRTIASTEAYGESGSVFWGDVREARKLLKYDLRIAMAHPETIDVILGNTANSFEVLQQADSGIQIRKLVGSLERPSSDNRDIITLVPYGLEGSLLDPANPGTPTAVPFLPLGKILFIGSGERRGYVVGEGATNEPEADLELGYTHIAPTVEGNGAPGRWARLFTPEGRPWQLQGDGVTNGVPVIRNNEKIVVASTEMP